MQHNKSFTAIAFLHSYLLTIDNETEHSIRLLNKLNEEMTAHFNGLLKLSNSRITEICKLDKQAWRSLDDVEMECKEKIEMIEKIRDEQVIVCYSLADLGTRYFQNFKLKAKWLFLYSRQEPSTLQPKQYKLKQEFLVSRKLKQEFYVLIKLKQAKRE